VRAQVPVELLALDRTAFHDLVSGSESARAGVTSIARARVAGDADR
jgi:hypothetical protein